jgi:hypothetical protein
VPLAAALEISEDEQLSEAALSYWTAWHFLTSDRPMGAMGGAGRIPFSVIDRYAEKNLFEDTELLARMLWAMDDVFLTHLVEQSKRRTASSGT